MSSSKRYPARAGPLVSTPHTALYSHTYTLTGHYRRDTERTVSDIPLQTDSALQGAVIQCRLQKLGVKYGKKLIVSLGSTSEFRRDGRDVDGYSPLALSSLPLKVKNICGNIETCACFQTPTDIAHSQSQTYGVSMYYVSNVSNPMSVVRVKQSSIIIEKHFELHR